jgi:hypothetical protein
MNAVAEALQLQPELSTAWIEQYYALVRCGDRERYIQGLRIGGLK